MGTNYYWHATAPPPPPQPCVTCGHEPDYEAPSGLHIGKSSAGWCFSLHVIPEEGISTLADWTERFNREGSVIVDEYGRVQTVAEMLATITERSGRDFEGRTWAGYGYADESDFHRKNNSQRGPNGLLRHALNHRSHVGHGEGTYDYIAGDFS